MDPVALLQEEVGLQCIGVHHRVQKDGHHARYLSHECICTLQLSWGFT
jgi:hypothetical protein